jgi:3-methylfumaryl-CoA hydratase
VSDVAASAPLDRLAALLGREDAPRRAGDVVFPGGHWLYCLSAVSPGGLGDDGHAVRGGFMPPVSLPKRMAAGGALRFLEPLRVGATLERRSRVGDVAVKEGRSGSLVFVHVRHELRQGSAVALVEDQRIVYSDSAAAAPSSPPRQGQTPSWTRTIRPDAALLFRYSALTYNGHRIHHDRRYATEEEGYPGLVVHGPLIATYLLDLCLRNRPESSVAEFAYRPLRPLFDDEAIMLAGRPDESGETAELWAIGPDGEVAIRASARFGAAGIGPV